MMIGTLIYSVITLIFLSSMQVTNNKGEQLYEVVFATTNDIMPSVYLKTWEKALAYFEDITKELDTKEWFRKVVKKKQVDDRLWATMIMEHRGWGSAYMCSIWVSPAYAFE